MSDYYLDEGLPQPVASEIDAPYWAGLRDNEMRLQVCGACNEWQWGPEWICHHCHSDDVSFQAVEPRGVIYSYERVWHPVHPALKEQGPYIVVLVQIPSAGDVRVIGDLLGDPKQKVVIGAEVEGVFEHHDGDNPHTLLHWRAS
jgi:uncharacterized OB-fold protein